VNRKIRSAITLPAAILALSAILFSLFARGTSAQAKDLHVMISDGMKTVVEELTPQIEHSTGRKLFAQFNSSKNLRDKIQAGEPFDAAILTSDVLDDLIKLGKSRPPDAPKSPAPDWEWAFAPEPRNPTSTRPMR